MTITREDLNPCTVKLHIVCDAAEVGEGFKKAYKKISKTIRLPGFRPGHAPKSMIEKMVDKGQVMDEAAETILRATLDKAIQQEEIRPDVTTAPIVEMQSLDEAAGTMEYSAKIPLPPQVELGEYKGLPLEKPNIEVTDEEIAFQLEEFRKRRATRESITDRGVSEGDISVINMKVDGEAGEGRSMMVVAGGSFPGLDEALAGMKPEEIKHVELDFPAGFQEKDLAGRKASVQVTVTTLSAPVLPPIDDSFAQSLQTENVEDLRTKIREGVQEAKESMVRDVLVAKLLDTLLERSQVHVSDPMWENLASRRLNEVAQEQAQEGKSLEAYAKENGMELEQYVQAWYERARMEVQRALLIQGIFAKEGIRLTNEDLNTELLAMAREFGMEPEATFKMLQENQAVEELQFRSISRRVGQVLLDNADVTTVDISAMTEESDAPAAVEASSEPEVEAVAEDAKAE